MTKTDSKMNARLLVLQAGRAKASDFAQFARNDGRHSDAVEWQKLAALLHEEIMMAQAARFAAIHTP